MAKLRGAVGRTDIQHMRVSDLHIDEAQNGRHFRPSESDVRTLALDIMAHGQLQPVVIYKIAGDTYALAAGQTRCRAINLINSDQDLRGKAGLAEGQELPVKCVTVRANEEDALLINIAENARRHATSPIDDAHNHEKLRRFGWTNAKIADLYGVSAARVSQLSNLLALSQKHQRLVHDRALNLTNAINLASLMPEEREVIVEQSSVDNNGGVAPEVDNKAVKEAIVEADPDKKKPTLKQIKDGLKEMIEKENSWEYYGGAINYRELILKNVLYYIEGQIGGEELDIRLAYPFFGEEPPKAERVS